VLDIVSLHNQGMMMLRAMLVQEMLQKFMDAGKQGATRARRCWMRLRRLLDDAERSSSIGRDRQCRHWQSEQ